MTGCGSILWMAPEILQGDRFNEKIDVYSYAMCLVEVVDRRLPWSGSGNPGIVPLKVSQGQRPEWQLRPAADRPELVELVRRCWDQEPCHRPDFSEVVRTVAGLRRRASNSSSGGVATAAGIVPIDERDEKGEHQEAEFGGVE
eukprot:COSAG01_NODE_4272_length_5193_cov_7.742638_6_plen_143_part_00